MLLGAALLACLVRATFPYGWSWLECLLLGTIFCATDPVVSGLARALVTGTARTDSAAVPQAALAVLKEAGMSPQLRTLVDLEAMLNDGCAYVCFELLRVRRLSAAVQRDRPSRAAPEVECAPRTGRRARRRASETPSACFSG